MKNAKKACKISVKHFSFVKNEKIFKKPLLFFKNRVIIARSHRGIVQLVEHQSPKLGVVGSSPSAPAKKKAIRVSGWLFSVKFALRASEIATL